MRYIYKLLTTILHPIVIPTIVIIGYFFVIKNTLTQQQNFAIISLVFVITYLIPLVLFYILKRVTLIKSFKYSAIKARKLPTIILIPLYYALGSLLFQLQQVREISVVFYGFSMGLFISYFYLLFKQRVSVQLLFLGTVTSFLIIVNNYNSFNFSSVICVLILITGLAGNSRLYLKQNTLKEILTGYIIGFLSCVIINVFL